MIVTVDYSVVMELIFYFYILYSLFLFIFMGALYGKFWNVVPEDACMHACMLSLLVVTTVRVAGDVARFPVYKHRSFGL